jgi:hypothetical protein
MKCCFFHLLCHFGLRPTNRMLSIENIRQIFHISASQQHGRPLDNIHNFAVACYCICFAVVLEVLDIPSYSRRYPKSNHPLSYRWSSHHHGHSAALCCHGCGSNSACWSRFQALTDLCCLPVSHARDVFVRRYWHAGCAPECATSHAPVACTPTAVLSNREEIKAQAMLIPQSWV